MAAKKPASKKNICPSCGHCLECGSTPSWPNPYQPRPFRWVEEVIYPYSQWPYTRWTITGNTSDTITVESNPVSSDTVTVTSVSGQETPTNRIYV